MDINRGQGTDAQLISLPLIPRLRYADLKYSAEDASCACSDPFIDENQEQEETDEAAMRRAGPRDATFELILEDHQIIMPWTDVRSKYRGHRDLEMDRKRLRQPRSATEAIPRTADDFQMFLDMSFQISEEGVMTNVFHVIRGPNVYKNETNLLCSNFASMTSDEATDPNPDYLEAANKSDVHPVLVRELASLILPSVQGQGGILSVAPNLAVQVKSGVSCVRTALRQACLDGTHGTRALYAIDRFGRAADELSLYDGRAYAYSAIYQDFSGMLDMFSHHVEVLADGQLRYHMTRLDTIALLADAEKLHAGITAFRNLQDMAAERRNEIIQAANARVAKSTISDGKEWLGKC